MFAEGGNYFGIFCLLEYWPAAVAEAGKIGIRLGLSAPKPAPSAAGEGRGYAGAEMESETAYQTWLAVLGNTNYPCVYVKQCKLHR